VRARDVIAVAGNLYQIGISRAIEDLRNSLPKNDPLPERLVETFKRFRNLHAHLKEWKDFHNHLNGIIEASDQFSKDVEQMCTQDTKLIDPRILKRRWNPVSQRLEGLLQWSKTIRHICIENSAPEAEFKKWFTDLNDHREDMNNLMQQSSVTYSTLSDLTQEIVDKVSRKMFWVDNSLHAVAIELDSISQYILGSFQQ
jgi:hypothetical protein